MTNPLDPKPTSRQLAWQHSRNQAGFCAICGTQPVVQGPDGKSRRRCLKCIVRQRGLERQRKGWKAQAVSGRGRPVVWKAGKMAGWQAGNPTAQEAAK